MRCSREGARSVASNITRSFDDFYRFFNHTSLVAFPVFPVLSTFDTHHEVIFSYKPHVLGTDCSRLAHILRSVHKLLAGLVVVRAVVPTQFPCNFGEVVFMKDCLRTESVKRMICTTKSKQDTDTADAEQTSKWTI